MDKSQDIYESQEKWISFLEKVYAETNRLLDNKCDIPYFRGHFKTNWELKPSIYRINHFEIKDKNIYQFENALVTDFYSLCGQLYNKELNDWEMVFEMRHADLPTRLLDWTESFANALFFALNDDATPDTIETIQPCIWILNPFKLNKKTYGDSTVPSVNALDFNYHVNNQKNWNILKKKLKGPIAIIPPRSHQRIFAQKSVFTCHFNETPIEKYHKSCVKKIEIPFECRDQAELFLFLAGVNEYSLFPDLDGLGAYLRKRFFNLRLLLDKRSGLESWYIPTGVLP